jgi:hypothetical protein
MSMNEWMSELLTDLFNGDFQKRKLCSVELWDGLTP